MDEQQQAPLPMDGAHQALAVLMAGVLGVFFGGLGYAVAKKKGAVVGGAVGAVGGFLAAKEALD